MGGGEGNVPRQSEHGERYSFVSEILDRRKVGAGYQYRVQFDDPALPPRWISRSTLMQNPGLAPLIEEFDTRLG
jgi:hypothetical protein